uniref:Biogenesis of lysosome-related organelles complex 1 subunit KXD1 n=1 Tax=Mycena chlorophos TaxID=658473 RepID=A0ABQ0L028_MYCCL|nr:predicted protein [Mycena chlorophos]
MSTESSATSPASPIVNDSASASVLSAAAVYTVHRAMGAPSDRGCAKHPETPTIISPVTVNGGIAGSVEFCPVIDLGGRRCTTLAWVSSENTAAMNASTMATVSTHSNVAQASGMVTMPAAAFQAMLDKFTHQIGNETRARYAEKTRYEAELSEGRMDLQELKKLNKSLLVKESLFERRLKHFKDRVKVLENDLRDCDCRVESDDHRDEEY